MKRSEDSEVGQGSRLVTAARRQAVAREKARIAGKKARKPSALELAAVEWEKEREARAREAEEERLGISRQVETCPLSFQLVSLPGDGDGSEPPADEVDWKPYSPQRGKGAATATRRANISGICALSRRLMAMERARVLGRQPADLGAYALEQAGRRWAEERDRRK